VAVGHAVGQVAYIQLLAHERDSPRNGMATAPAPRTGTATWDTLAATGIGGREWEDEVKASRPRHRPLEPRSLAVYRVGPKKYRGVAFFGGGIARGWLLSSWWRACAARSRAARPPGRGGCAPGGGCGSTTSAARRRWGGAGGGSGPSRP